MTIEDAAKQVEAATAAYRTAFLARIDSEAKESLAGQAYTAAHNATNAARKAEADAVTALSAAGALLMSLLPAPPPMSQTT